MLHVTFQTKTYCGSILILKLLRCFQFCSISLFNWPMLSKVFHFLSLSITSSHIGHVLNLTNEFLHYKAEGDCLWRIGIVQSVKTTSAVFFKFARTKSCNFSNYLTESKNVWKEGRTIIPQAVIYSSVYFKGLNESVPLTLNLVLWF